jgi:WD40 repeat protein
MAMAANAVAWNPREPFNFALASEDSHAYTFDMRRLGAALVVHKDHVAAVMDVAFSPTGRELATASYDRTLRLWAHDGGKSRDGSGGQSRHHPQRSQSLGDVAERTGVERRQSEVTSSQGHEQVNDFRTANFSKHNAVGAHAQ